MTRPSTEIFSEDTQRKIRKLLERQGLGVLSTKDEDGHPYASLIAFAPDRDMSELYFITPNDTRKNANLQHDGRAAMLINDCVNKPDDFHQAMAVTVLGRAYAVGNDRREAILAIYLGRHSYLQKFAHSPSCTLYALKITGFAVVQQFQNVSELKFDHALDPDT